MTDYPPPMLTWLLDSLFSSPWELDPAEGYFPPQSIFQEGCTLLSVHIGMEAFFPPPQICQGKALRIRAQWHSRGSCLELLVISHRDGVSAVSEQTALLLSPCASEASHRARGDGPCGLALCFS